VSAASARPAEPDDLPAIVELAENALTELRAHRGGAMLARSLGRDEPLLESLRGDLDDESSMVWCGQWEGIVVGYAVARLIHDTDTILVQVDDLYTQLEVRDVGVGEALLSAAIAWAIASGASGIDAFTLPGARDTKNLFERFGMKTRLLTVHKDLD
jgi:GNAT superfamily N-acetyltransferase